MIDPGSHEGGTHARVQPNGEGPAASSRRKAVVSEHRGGARDRKQTDVSRRGGAGHDVLEADNLLLKRLREDAAALDKVCLVVLASF